jgi:hypothetical protein
MTVKSKGILVIVFLLPLTPQCYRPFCGNILQVTFLLQKIRWLHGVSLLIYCSAFLSAFLIFEKNLPLVYRWVGLKTHDHDFVASLDFEENVLLRPYGDDYPGFTCASILNQFNQPTSLIHDLKAGDHRSLAYLSTVNPGWLPIFSSTGIQCTPTAHIE